MDRANEKLRELLSDKLGNLTAPVDPGLWNGVQSGIQSSAAGAGGAVSTGIGWLPWAAAVVVGAGIVAAVSFFGPEKTPLATPNAEMPTNEKVLPAEELGFSQAESSEKTEETVVSSPSKIDDKSSSERSMQIQAPKEEDKDSSTPYLMTNASTSANPASDSKQKPKEAPQTANNDRLTIMPPVAKFDAFPSREDLLRFSFTPVSDENYTQYVWQFGDGQTSEDRSPEHSYGNPGEYTVSLSTTNADGMTAKEEMTIKAFPQGKLILPNIFTPDGDNINDLYDITSTSENVEIIAVSIANAKGQLVFELTDDRPVWDGNDKYGQPCAVGAYMVSATAKEKNGDIIKQSGIVHLKR